MKQSFIKGLASGALLLTGAAAASAQTYTNEPASVVWSFNEIPVADPVLTPAEAFSFANFNINGNSFNGTCSTTMCPDITFVRIKPANGAADIVEWGIKPATGLTFTPTKVTGYIAKYGTDSEPHAVTIKMQAGDKTVTLGTLTPHRHNKTQEEDKYGKEEDYTTQFSFTLTSEQQAELASSEQIKLISNLGVGNTKDADFSDIHIEGIINGTKVAVAKYTLSAVANPEEAATIAIVPEAAEYESGTPVTVTATKKFGYAFVNWTDQNGKEVSTDPEYSFSIEANTQLTANFNKVNTYILTTGTEGGANSYQVQVSPAPTLRGGRKMYEEGTKVTLTAISNPIVTFTNWSDGQTDAEIEVVMDDNKTVKAVFESSDYIAGWDFYRQGYNGRPADFASEDNDVATLTLRNAEGEIQGWLDKSQSAGGYEGRPGAVNWRTVGLGDFYWETKVNASNFTNIKLITAMVLNYNSYSVQNVQYSLDGETWKTLGSITLPGAKTWVDGTFEFPEDANNASDLYIRWIADKTSEVKGTTSNNDGICLGASYVIGDMKVIDDSTAPVLLSTVPEEGATSASTNGRVVLSFDEKVKLADDAEASLGDLKLKGEVSGKTVTFNYKNLAFNTAYTFTLPAGVVSDLTDNTYTEAVKINFTTRNRPVVAKAAFNFTVPDDGTIAEAFAAAAKRDDNTQRYRIFVRNGEYILPANGNTVGTLVLSTPNVSVIGESREGTVITCDVPDGAEEGIGKCDMIQIASGANNSYWQDITLRHGNDKDGRRLAIHEFSDKTIMKNVCLWAFQDTYTTDNANGRSYFEGGVLRGRTDYLCGKGDIFYNGVTLQVCGKGGYITAPSIAKQYGYVFKDCEIVGEDNDTDGSFYLGRPWGEGTPMSIWIDTKMTARPTAEGWTEMGDDGHPKRFAEYNSTTANGTPVDLSKRKSVFGKVSKVPNNPVLTKEEAAEFSYANVMGADDNWDPAAAAEQAPLATGVGMINGKLVWNDNNYVSCWAVYNGDKLLCFTTVPEYTLPTDSASDSYSIRSANEMGGLSDKVTVTTSGIEEAMSEGNVATRAYYNLQGLRVNPADAPAVMIEVTTYTDGTTRSAKIVK